MTAVGIGEKDLGYFHLDFYACPQCKKHGTTGLIVCQDYLTFLFIPIVPAGKSGRIRCSACKYEKEQVLFSAEELTEFKINRKKTKTPVWTATGLFAIAIFMVIILYIGFSGSGRRGLTPLEKRICFPEKGDLFQVRWEDRDYSWFKIDSVDQDSVWVLSNLSSTPIPAGLSAIRNEAYDTTLVSYGRNDLKKMYLERQIRDVIRAKK